MTTLTAAQGAVLIAVGWPHSWGILWEWGWLIPRDSRSLEGQSPSRVSTQQALPLGEFPAVLGHQKLIPASGLEDFPSQGGMIFVPGAGVL